MSRRSRTTVAVRRSGAGSKGRDTHMARYTGADCRRCRREKMKLFLKGSKCDGPKCPFESRPFPPGQHGRGRLKETEYLLQLREKQKARRVYGVLEKQFQIGRAHV